MLAGGWRRWSCNLQVSPAAGYARRDISCVVREPASDAVEAFTPGDPTHVCVLTDQVGQFTMQGSADSLAELLWFVGCIW